MNEVAIITINNADYQIGKLTPRSQLHVLRRLAPSMFAMSGVFEAKDDQEGLMALGGVAKALAEMSDNDVDYVLDRCMAVVSRKDSTGQRWVRVQANGSQQLMFEDITMQHMMQLTIKVLEENLGNFSEALQKLVPGMQAPATA